MIGRRIPLDERTFVGGQVFPDEMADLAAEGVTLVVNNRVEGEEPGQPASDQLRTAAEAAGIAYRHIPVAGGFSKEQVEALAEALGGAEGKVMLFCRSGTRSAHLWALAEASRGGDGESLIAKAGAAGYDLSSLRPYL
ncbi:TIGR01244 family sulfur transferase [Sphingosinicella sp. CPCC 101087]|uniref:TIGR01244 family sulfur transferase n=1 Tax=Sphingosinicella sp. CPCC 101087 TaxID=2497754 RepID=UPI00101C37A6|nr:TIGR01244 family sulfur transferase [Sphingosinicella sp. CPCC 101087]